MPPSDNVATTLSTLCPERLTLFVPILVSVPHLSCHQNLALPSLSPCRLFYLAISIPCATYFAYFLVNSLASLSNAFLSFLNFSAAPASTASSGTGSLKSDWVAVNTLKIFELGFHASGLRIPMHMLPCSSNVTFGWYMRVLNEILGGLKGYS
jgi:hypothetical protein